MIPFIGFSQHTRKVFVETGISTFKPFVKEERVFGNADYQYSANLKNTYKTTSGFFVKCGIEILPKTEKKFSITVPLSIGYKEFNKKIVKEGYAYGCFLSFNGTEKSQIIDKPWDICAVAGFQLGNNESNSNNFALATYPLYISFV